MLFLLAQYLQTSNTGSNSAVVVHPQRIGDFPVGHLAGARWAQSATVAAGPTSVCKTGKCLPLCPRPSSRAPKSAVRAHVGVSARHHLSGRRTPSGPEFSDARLPIFLHHAARFSDGQRLARQAEWPSAFGKSGHIVYCHGSPA